MSCILVVLPASKAVQQNVGVHCRFFSNLSKLLDRLEIYSLQDLMDMWDRESKMNTKTFRVEEIGDFKEFSKTFIPDEKDPQRLVGHTKPHTFIFKKRADGMAVMQVIL
jgi:hypothetical protein